jgi:hypothetical protein
MVAIERTQSDPKPSSSSHQPSEEDRYRLVYSKSKVYIHPTAYSRDNIPGFVSLVKRVRASPLNDSCILTSVQQEAINPIYLLAWIPESLLHEKGTAEWDKFVKIEERVVVDDEDSGA